jgi:hypothetical protein
MKQQIRAFIGGLALALVLAGTLVNASPQWAVTTTNSDVYLLDYSHPGTPTNATGTIPQGSGLGGVAVWGNYAFVAGSAGKLYIGKIDTTGLIPKINWLNNVTLSTSTGDLMKPTAVAVDGTGGVYVINDPSGPTHSSFAYLPSSGKTWASSGLNVFTIVDSHGNPTALCADVATSESGTQAIIAHRDTRDGDTHFPDQSWVSAITGGSVSTNLPEDKGYEPRGIAMGTNGLSYMVNHSTDMGHGPAEQGSISVISSSSLASVVTAAIGTGTFRPTDVSFFTRGSASYLGIVGTTDGRAEAMRITLGADGSPSMGTAVSKTLDISNAFCSVSLDGSVFWITNPGTGVVTALDTLNWTAAGVTWSVPGQPQYIAAFTPSVPEPSSLAVLLTGSIGLIGTLRRRRRR